jgi:hypothetical protein
MRSILASATAFVLSLAAPQTAAADVVIELFTSQGCSSCPPADALLGQLAERDDVIALSLHVDYWDYLGWKDAFAQPAFTARQKRYAAAASSTMIYTPQMVIGGTDHIVGTRGMELSEQINRHKTQTSDVVVGATRDGDMVQIQAAAKSQAAMVVQLVRFSPKEVVKIQRGENAGRELTYHNVVTSWTVVTQWDGASPLEVAAPAGGDASTVVIIQDGEAGPILAATKVE